MRCEECSVQYFYCGTVERVASPITGTMQGFLRVAMAKTRQTAEIIVCGPYWSRVALSSRIPRAAVPSDRMCRPPFAFIFPWPRHLHYRHFPVFRATESTFDTVHLLSRPKPSLFSIFLPVCGKILFADSNVLERHASLLEYQNAIAKSK